MHSPYEFDFDPTDESLEFHFELNSANWKSNRPDDFFQMDSLEIQMRRQVNHIGAPLSIDEKLKPKNRQVQLLLRRSRERWTKMKPKKRKKERNEKNRSQTENPKSNQKGAEKKQENGQ